MSKPRTKLTVDMSDGSKYHMTNAQVLQFIDTMLAKNKTEWLNVLANDKKYQQQARRLTKVQRQGIANLINAINQPCSDAAIGRSIGEICGAISQITEQNVGHIAVSKRKPH